MVMMMVIVIVEHCFSVAGCVAFILVFWGENVVFGRVKKVIVGY